MWADGGRKCKMENAISFILFCMKYSGIISVPPWGTQNEFEDEKCIDSIWFILFLLFWQVVMPCTDTNSADLEGQPFYILSKCLLILF